MAPVLLIIHGIIVVSFVVLGIVFLRGKGAFLIAGYNTSSQAQKDKTDEKALCKAVGKVMFVLAACWILIALGSFPSLMFFRWIGLGLFFVTTIGFVIYANTGNRFKK